MSYQRHLHAVILLATLTFESFVQFSHQQQCPTTQCDCVSTNGVLQISCRDKQLTNIPTFSDTGTTYDEITFGSSHPTGCSQPSCSKMNRIATVPANAFANLRVKKIVLTQNAIGTYDSNAFVGVEGVLENLELEGDGTNVFPIAIGGLNNLQVLFLEHFREQTMTQSNTLSTLPKLTQLAFKKINNLNNILYNAFYNGPEQSKSPKFPLLNTFHLNDVPTLTAIPVAAIQELTGLTELDISGTGITRVYQQTFSPFNKLINLHITYNNYLTTIDSGAFDGIYDTLEFLFLGHNQLQSLTSLSAGNWQKLTQLNLQYNPIGTVQASDFSTLGQKLRYLNLDSCELTSIHSSMFNTLTGLHTLVLSNNEIQGVPDYVFQNIQELTELRLDTQKNAMTLNDNSFSGIETSLNHLIINNNAINKQTFWRLLDKLPNLLELNAGKLNLQTIPDKAFENNDRISILDLESNGITALQESSFFRLRYSLEVLTLSYNSLTTISKCVLNGFTRLHQLHLSGNPLVCDCKLQWLRDWVWAQPDRFLAGGLVGPCTSPPALASRLLSEISSDDLTCDAGYVEPTCTDLYATTTPSTTIGNPTIPSIKLTFGLITDTSITIIWGVSDSRNVSGYVLHIYKGDASYRTDLLIEREKNSETILELESNTYFTFCMHFKLNGIDYPHNQDCITGKTTDPLSTLYTTIASTISTPGSNVGPSIESGQRYIYHMLVLVNCRFW